MDLVEVFRMMGAGVTGPELLEAYSAAKAEMEAERRAPFAAFGVPSECLWPATRVFHQHSKVTTTWWPLITTQQAEELTHNLDYKRYPGAPRVALPRPEALAAKLEDVVRARRSVRSFDPGPIRLAQLAKLLELGAGVMAVDDEVPRRAQPSGGALYPVETYPIALRVDGLAPGVYHYAALDHELEQVRALPGREDVRHALPEALYDAAPPLVIVLTVVFARSQTKYMERGYRFALLEAGHIAQNVCLTAGALGLASVCMGGFFDDDLNALVGVDEEKEAAIYGVLVGSHPGAR